MPANKKEVFANLSKIAVGGYVKHSKAEDGTMLPYLPWTHAHQLMMDQYPEYEWSFAENPDGLEVFYFKDGTAEVRVVMSIGDITMIASKTVTNGTGKAYPNPNANDIHNAKMRCRTRAMAELGLGWDLWINPQDYPYEKPKSEARAATQKTKDSKQRRSTEDEIFSKLCSEHDQKKAFALYKKVEGAWKNRKLDPKVLEEKWTNLKKEKGWK